MSATRFRVDARDERRLMRLFDKLPDRVASRAAKKAVMAGATPIARAARAEVAVDEGTLKKSIGRKSKGYRRAQTAVALIGPRVSHGGRHGHLVHDGHINVDGSFTPGDPWLKRAQDQSATAARSAMHAKLAQEIEKEAKKLA